MKKTLKILLWLVIIYTWIGFVVEIIIKPCIKFYKTSGVSGVLYWIGVLTLSAIALFVYFIAINYLFENTNTNIKVRIMNKTKELKLKVKKLKEERNALIKVVQNLISVFPQDSANIEVVNEYRREIISNKYKIVDRAIKEGFTKSPYLYIWDSQVWKMKDCSVDDLRYHSEKDLLTIKGRVIYQKGKWAKQI